MQHHVTRLVRLYGSGFRCDRCNPVCSIVPNILLAKLRQLADAGTRVSAEPRHPSLCGEGFWLLLATAEV